MVHCSISRCAGTWDALSSKQKTAITDMSYQLGSGKLHEFKQMQAALKSGNYHQAAADMGNSEYCRQVPRRCHANQKLIQNQ